MSIVSIIYTSADKLPVAAYHDRNSLNYQQSDIIVFIGGNVDTSKTFSSVLYNLQTYTAAVYAGTCRRPPYR